MRIMLNLPLKCKTYYIILIIYGKKIYRKCRTQFSLAFKLHSYRYNYD